MQALDRPKLLSIVRRLDSMSVTDPVPFDQQVAGFVTELQQLGAVPNDMVGDPEAKVAGSDACVRWYAGQLLYALSDPSRYFVVNSILQMGEDVVTVG